MLSLPHSHKTVIVLDRSPFFAQSCKESVDYDVQPKIKSQGFIPAAPISKTLWTANVEAILEYIRVVYDIFPGKKLFQVITSDSNSQRLNTWMLREQSTHQIMLGLARIGPPSLNDSGDDYSVMHGLSQAIEVLCEPSEGQHEARTSLTEDARNIRNWGRIICLTALKSEATVRMLEECCHDAIIQHNNLAAGTDNLLPIDHCELILIHVMPVGEETKMINKGKKEVSSFLTSEVHTTQSGRALYVKMMQLAQKHYQLSSTTVTGIPMKEEQNASSSANYDVELLHPAEVHVELLKTAHHDGLVIPSKEGLNIETVTLKWCTPKSNAAELHHCMSVVRITPVDVNSRPSSCLTNFLLGGRSVMLEQPRKTGTKVISHMLASHGGEIFIHAINTSRSILEDPPSISEGCGGRVTDYRITDFGEFMKENRLAPVPPQSVTDSTDMPIDKATSNLERKTRHWPMVIGETIIFNMPMHLEQLPALIVKEVLDDEEVLECKKVIYHIVGMESKNEPLPVPSTGSRGKGLKRDEQYRQMWSELEVLVRSYSATSDQHNKVLECLLECKKPSPEDLKMTSAQPKKAATKPFVKESMNTSTTGVEKGLKELDRFQMMTEREKQDFMTPDRPSPDSPPAKRFRPYLESSITRTAGPQNLLAMWTNRLSAISSKRHSEFSGRQESMGGIAELYQHLNEENTGPQRSLRKNKTVVTPNKVGMADTGKARQKQTLKTQVIRE